jgi:hypothetical protein
MIVCSSNCRDESITSTSVLDFGMCGSLENPTPTCLGLKGLVVVVVVVVVVH